MRLRINLVKNSTRKILSKISRANQYQTRNSKIFEGKKMKEKKKKRKETRFNPDTLPRSAENQSLLRTLIATKPMNDARYRPVKRGAPYFEKEYPEPRVG